MAAVSEETTPPTTQKKPPGLCIGLRKQIQESAERQREARSNRHERPQPWIVRKLAVFMVFGILGYTYYVYVVRFCIKMIRSRTDAKGSRAQGIADTVIFNILFLALLWAYAKAILTPAGFAKDYTQKCPPPEPHFSSQNWNQEDSLYSDDGSSSFRVGPEYAPSERPHSIRSPTTADFAQASSLPNQETPDLERGGPFTTKTTEQVRSPTPPRASSSESAAQAYARSYVESLRATSSRVATPTPSNPPRKEGDAAANVVELDAIPAVARLHPPPQTDSNSTTHPQLYSKETIQRRPNTNPILAPEYRYCRRDEIVKPARAHHCRICGTCTLMFDHHCPWIGQCVGARNRRFFLIFCGYNTIFCLWIALTLITGVTTHTDHVDGHEIAIIVLAFLFTLFTGALTITHTTLIMMNVTTVEQLSMQSMRHRETALLHAAFEFWDFTGKRNKQREWDAEWGRIGREGNLWWLGSSRKNWVAMMGPSPVYWFFPIGNSVSDGLSFPMNPRFDEYGRWRRRREWPTELQ